MVGYNEEKNVKTILYHHPEQYLTLIFLQSHPHKQVRLHENKKNFNKKNKNPIQTIINDRTRNIKSTIKQYTKINYKTD